MNVATIIVTYNRVELLKKSVSAHLNQSKQSDVILVVNNASTDGTTIYLDELENRFKNIRVINLKENTGGAGGFYYGLNFLKDEMDTIDWVWMMDDDAIPNINALENLCKYAHNESNIYASLPQEQGICSWSNLNMDSKELKFVNNYNEIEEVKWAPFLGFFISLDLVKMIGLPNKGYFLAADDVEYSMRAKKYGSQIFIVRDSILNHPLSDTYKISIGYRSLTNLRLIPWKRYYDTRNRIFIAKKYYGLRLYTQTIPASFLRLMATLICETNRLKQLKAFWAGLYDGMLEKQGKRHDYWEL